MRIATHQSPLALMYTDQVVSEIQSLYPHMSIELVKVSINDGHFYFDPLPEWGGKCLFAKEVDQTLLDGRADIAIHVIEERVRENQLWPKGWLCTTSHMYEDNSFYFFTDVKKIAELFFSPSARLTHE